jgi:hypothetical protein
MRTQLYGGKHPLTSKTVKIDLNRRSEVQILRPPLRKQFRAGLWGRPFCCPEIHPTLNSTDVVRGSSRVAIDR